jgi:hypothetical protein
MPVPLQTWGSGTDADVTEILLTLPDIARLDLTKNGLD